MCLALPALVVALQAGGLAIVDLGGVRKQVSLALTPEAQVGDYVIVHVGHAIGVLERWLGRTWSVEVAELPIGALTAVHRAVLSASEAETLLHAAT